MSVRMGWIMVALVGVLVAFAIGSMILESKKPVAAFEEGVTPNGTRCATLVGRNGRALAMACDFTNTAPAAAPAQVAP